MEGGLISAQQFEEGARGFAHLWEACSNAEQLWIWVPSGNQLVGHCPPLVLCEQALWA